MGHEQKSSKAKGPSGVIVWFVDWRGHMQHDSIACDKTASGHLHSLFMWFLLCLTLHGQIQVKQKGERGDSGLRGT